MEPVELSIRPYGAWPSPISAELLVAGAAGLGEVVVCGGADGSTRGSTVWWAESRPDEGGRTVVVRRTADGTVADAVPAGVDVRTGVHEYGGGAWWVANGVLVHSDRSDERLIRREPGRSDGEPVVLTPEPEVERGLRYADGRITPDGRWYVCVREAHPGEAHVGPGSEPANELVAVAMDGSQRVEVLVSGPDFVSSPRVSPDGGRLAWIQWNHPDLPWDDTELWVGDLHPDGRLGGARRIGASAEAGVTGPAGYEAGESFFQPEWRADGVLHVVTDRDDWWHLYRVDPETDTLEQLTTGTFEVASPQWVFGLSRYAFVGADIWFARREGGVDRLAVFAADGPAVGGPAMSGGIDIEPLTTEEPATSIGSLATYGDGVALVAASWNTEPELVVVNRDGSEVLRARRDLGLDQGWLPVPEQVTFPTSGDEQAHAVVYPPTNPDHGAPADERPPLLVLVHGGPTGSVRTQMQLAVAFWTSRGFAVADVDYRGSTGYGRPYRHRLRGGWGVLDVDDCVAVARYLSSNVRPTAGRVDGDRLAIRGGSAGGFTVLAALTFHDVFTAGASRYGIADLAALAADTHKFEARYLDRLVGRWPEDEAIYRERSPIHHVGRLSTPLLLLQGSEDRVVPPSQAHAMAEALARRGVPHELIEFPDEGHGFRKASNVVRALEAELAFFADRFGFEPAG
jgi:dipeptidyl aminopeptidase/acylaminoacyl peptidase